jgi:hypothetical protein
VSRFLIAVNDATHRAIPKKAVLRLAT